MSDTERRGVGSLLSSPAGGRAQTGTVEEQVYFQCSGLVWLTACGSHRKQEIDLSALPLVETKGSRDLLSG